jgi:hypothetical protein
MTVQLIALGVIVFALMADHVQLRNKVERLTLELRGKVDKPSAETPFEQHKREREERIARQEKG